jgi:hypothetical protein
VRLLALVAALVLAVGITGGATTAFAADTHAQAALSKNIKMPVGTTTPTANFVFAVAAVSVDGLAANDATNPTNMPAIGDITVSFTSADAGTATSDVKSVKKESGNILSGVSFPHPGKYVYRITEKATSSYQAGTNETLSYSPAVYEMTIYVKQSSDNSAISYPAVITTTVVTVDNSDQTQDDKVNSTPGGTGGGSSEMIFTSTYLKRSGVDPATDSALTLSKTVTGEYGSTALYFTFDLSVTKPSLVSGNVDYKAYVTEGSSVVTSAANGTVAGTDSYGGYLSVTPGTVATVKLKHGQKLVVTNVYVGTTYTVNEAATPEYTPSVIVTTAGIAAAPVAGNEGAALASGTQLVGDGANGAAYTNDNPVSSPTGINLDDLPFYGIVLICLAALAVYVAVSLKRRRKRG